MSAIRAAIHPQSPAFRAKLTEADALCEISRQLAHAGTPDQALEAMALTALRIPGVHQIEIEKRVYGRVPARARVGTARSDSVVASFDLHSSSLESPVRFVRFLSQQIRRANELAALRNINAAISGRPQAIREVLARRKTIQRAGGIVSSREALDSGPALLQMRRWSRQQEKSLVEISREIIQRDIAESGLSLYKARRRA